MRPALEVVAEIMIDASSSPSDRGAVAIIEADRRAAQAEALQWAAQQLRRIQTVKNHEVTSVRVLLEIEARAAELEKPQP